MGYLLRSLPEPVALAIGLLVWVLIFVGLFSHPRVRPRAVLLTIVAVIGSMTALGWLLYALGLTS